MRDTKQKQIFDAASGGASAKTPFSDIVAIGTVIDTNDPMQWGRVRIMVPAWGENIHHKVEGIPWAMYVTPFGGQTNMGTRGAGIEQTSGGVAYGMWAIPKVGAQVVVMSLDEDHNQRLFMGCVYDAHTTHTLPHGRWNFDDHPELKEKPKAPPYGPYSSGDKLIQPLADNLQKAFGHEAQSKEWQTRAADYAVSRVDVSHLAYTATNIQDDQGHDTGEGWVSTQGYQVSRHAPAASVSGNQDRNYDSQVYSMTSPGFHSLSMDDRMENCRVRLRTMSGHQILMDDTNERIYIATAQGNNWIELDQAGNIDIFTANKVNIRAAQDINLTSDKTIRMYAKEGIHMRSDKEVRIQASEDIHIKSDQNIRQRAGKDTYIQSDSNLHIKTQSNTNLTSGSNVNVKGSSIIMNASTISHNGSSAASADGASEQQAFYTNRIPAHEPWARMMTKASDSLEGELSYDDPKVGKFENGKEIKRGLYWRR